MWIKQQPHRAIALCFGNVGDSKRRSTKAVSKPAQAAAKLPSACFIAVWLITCAHTP